MVIWHLKLIYAPETVVLRTLSSFSILLPSPRHAFYLVLVPTEVPSSGTTFLFLAILNSSSSSFCLRFRHCEFIIGGPAAVGLSGEAVDVRAPAALGLLAGHQGRLPARLRRAGPERVLGAGQPRNGGWVNECG